MHTEYRVIVINNGAVYIDALTTKDAAVAYAKEMKQLGYTVIFVSGCMLWAQEFRE